MTFSTPKARLGLAVALALAAFAVPAKAVEKPIPPQQSWSFSGPFGKFDRAQLQRGFKVAREVCASCHAMSLVRFRNLSDPGGPEFTPGQVRALAANYQITAGPNDTGEMFQRPGLASDAFPAPFPNEQAARAANGGALPPDLSLITKAREGGAQYVHALLTGYEDPPPGVTLMPGMNYNKYFAGHQIAMAQPLSSDGQVEYTDGTQPTVEQMVRDVSQFLTWAAEPELEQRKAMGVKMVIFLVILGGFAYAIKRKVWSDVH